MTTAPLAAIASAAIAMVVAGALVTLATVDAAAVPSTTGAVGGAGCLLLGLALVTGLRFGVAPAVGLLAASCALSLVGAGPSLRLDSVVGGVACLAVVEASYWSLEWRRPVKCAPGLLGRTAARWVAIGCGGGATAFALLAIADRAPEGGLGFEALGVLAAMALVALVVVLARKPYA